MQLKLQICHQNQLRKCCSDVIMAHRKVDSDEDDFLPSKRFRKSISAEEEAKKLLDAVPLSTRYKNKWAVKTFEEWKLHRENKLAKLEQTSLEVELELIENLDSNWEKMSPHSLDFWIGKFIQEVTDKKGRRYPGSTLLDRNISW